MQAARAGEWVWGKGRPARASEGSGAGPRCRRLRAGVVMVAARQIGEQDEQCRRASCVRVGNGETDGQNDWQYVCERAGGGVCGAGGHSGVCRLADEWTGDHSKLINK